MLSDLVPKTQKSLRYGPKCAAKNQLSPLFISFIYFFQAVNAFCLMLLTIPSIALMTMQLKYEKNKRIVHLGQRSIGIICMALTAWINDRFFCSYWAGVGFPYLHGVWHILIFLSSYSSIVLFAYCDVVNHMPDKLPILK